MDTTNSERGSSAKKPLILELEDLKLHDDAGSSPVASTNRNPIIRSPLVKPLWTSVLWTVWTSSLLILAILLALYGYAVLYYDGSPSKESPKALLVNVSKYGPTIFPILYAAVVGSSIKSHFSLNLEQGSSIGFLNQLSASTTLVGTLSAIVRYRALNVLSVALVALWVISPLGGQASLRVLSFAEKVASTPATFSYHDVLDIGRWTAFPNSFGKTNILPINALFVSALMTPKERFDLPVDNWGNVRIPMIETIQGKPDRDGWVSTAYGEGKYASLIGLPVSPSNEVSGNSGFRIRTSYWSVSCKTSESEPPEFDPNTWTNITASPGMIAVFDTPWSFDTMISRPNVKGRPFYIYLWDTRGKSHALCNIKTTSVQADVACHLKSCLVYRLRAIKGNHPDSEGWTQLDTNPLLFKQFFSYFLSIFEGHTASSTPLSAYFTNPRNAFEELPRDSAPALWTLDPKAFSTSLAQLLNTYYIAGSAMYSIPHGFNPSTLSPDAAQGIARVIRATEGYTLETVEVIKCIRPWCYFLIFSCTAMVVFGLRGLRRFWCCWVPEMELDVDAVVRDCPYAPVTAGNSEVAEKKGMGTRLGKDVKVRIGDAEAAREVGHIGVGLVEVVKKIGGEDRGRVYG